MTDRSATEFVRQLAAKPVLQQELATAVAGTSDPSEVVTRMIGFAAAHGFEVTPEDLAEAGALPLGEEQLAHVAGGAETVHLYLRGRLR